ncbi:GPP34 family phosphoprotein [Streptomyces sp. NPDC020141]|uniref:GOLPH3/VPS74 family protein n=1 Tax=Streptomyces sp. NPDC020141 TaxID=3365065 RepID=UPI00379A383B
METTLGEQLLLLSLDDESGAGRESANVGWAIAGASLVELALAGRITVDGDIVSAIDPSPVGHPSLDAALAAIAGREKPGRAADWIQHLRKDAVAAASAGLVDKGLVREETKKVLGLFPVRRYPEADGSVEAAVRERLDAAVLRGGSPDERTASLIALLHGGGLARLAFPAADTSRAEAAMEAIARGHWAAPAVHRVVESVRATLTVIVTTTVVTTVIAGN